MNLNKYSLALFALTALMACHSKNKTDKDAKSNHLISESSVYLLQHAHNPVDWYPWNDEALAKAKSEKKLMVISIGYSSCHWCHVMERETFSDTAVSRVMNSDFVSIKVDREERPDVDNVYMTACQIMNQGSSCGWPLNAIALPDGRPVWVGTYLKRDEWLNLLAQISELYIEDQNELYKIANQIANHLQSDHRFKLSENLVEFAPEDLITAQKQILPDLDFNEGGKKGDIKFPLPTLIKYMLQYGHSFSDKKANEWAAITLQKMMDGGIYDQLSGGFARYSTDAQWRVPHFEKMLYDNALLMSTYSDFYKISKSEDIEELLKQGLAFMKSEFSSGSGKYFASFDAESEGEEGKFYVWTKSEIEKIITDPSLLELIIERYGISEEGNWEKSKNVLIIHKSIDELAKKFKLDKKTVKSRLALANQKLLEARNKRISPALDKKIISSWNAMTAIAFADAFSALGTTNYRDEALAIAGFLKNEMMGQDFSLKRTSGDQKTNSGAFLDDYAFTILCFIRMYEISFDENWLNTARSMCDFVIANYSDEEGVYFYLNSSKDPNLIARKKELIDQVIPSSNSVMCDVLHKLGLYFYDEKYLRRSEHMLLGILEGPAKESGLFYSNWLRKQIEFSKPLYEVAIVGPDFASLKKELLSQYVPNAILLGGADEGSLELLKEKLQEGSTYIYVCRNKVCKLPVTKVAEAINLMN